MKWRILRRSEELLQHDVHAPHHLREQEVVARLVKHALLLLIPSLRPGYPEALGGRPLTGGCPPGAGREGGRRNALIEQGTRGL